MEVLAEKKMNEVTVAKKIKANMQRQCNRISRQLSLKFEDANLKGNQVAHGLVFY